MSDFKIGQLVACRQAACAEWLLGIFDGEKGGRFYVRPPLSLTCASKKSEWFSQVEPAEHIWPGIFIACDREIIDSLRQELDKERQITEQNICAVELEQELVQRLRSQIRWLCKELQAIGDRNGSQECPPVPHGDCRIGNCAECWEVASLKAVEDADGD